MQRGGSWLGAGSPASRSRRSSIANSTAIVIGVAHTSRRMGNAFRKKSSHSAGDSLALTASSGLPHARSKIDSIARA